MEPFHFWIGMCTGEEALVLCTGDYFVQTYMTERVVFFALVLIRVIKLKQSNFLNLYT